MSSTLLDARGVGRRFGDHTILGALDLRVAGADRIGLLGPNGSGKSTLLRLLAGEDAPDAGEIHRHGRSVHIPQLARRSDDRRTVREIALEQLGAGAVNRALQAAEADLATASDEAIARHAEALERWLASGAATADAEIEAAAARIGLPAGHLDRPRAELSSGQSARAGLLPLAARRHDVLLLDEPTNHLDTAGRAVLESLLAAHQGALVLASHDRALLAAHTDRILRLDARTGEAEPFGGGWEAYEREQDAAARRAQHEWEHATRRRDELVAAEREIRRRAAATRSKIGAVDRDGDKHVKEWYRSRADGVAARGRVVGARAARVEVPDRPWQDRPLALELTPAEERADHVIALEGAVMRRGAETSAPISLTIAAGERVLLRGPNGSGKSTLLEALAGILPLESGTRTQGPGAVVSVLGAVETQLAGDEPTVSAVRALTGLDAQHARARLAHVGLGPGAAARPASTLSPGERTRAELAVLGARRTTCLLLDEPSNHLDLASLEALEAALDGWPGAVVLASHDPRLMGRIGASRAIDLAAWGESARGVQM